MKIYSQVINKHRVSEKLRTHVRGCVCRYKKKKTKSSRGIVTVGRVSQGEWWLVDGTTIVELLVEHTYEQRTWGYGAWARDLGPLRRRKCAAYIRPRTLSNQHPVHSWTHPEHREHKNEEPGTSTRVVV